jgi:hypothetical protein
MSEMTGKVQDAISPLMKDGETYGEWAKSVVKGMRNARIKSGYSNLFRDRQDAEEWFVDNRDWVGNFERDGANDTQVMQAASALCELHDLTNVPIKTSAGASFGFKDSYNSFFTQRDFINKIEISSFDAIRSKETTMEKFRGTRYGLTAEENNQVDKLMKMYDEKAPEAHTMFMDWGGNDVRATVFHEFGHLVHSRFDAIDGDFYKRGWRSHSPTERGKDTWQECIAENFTLWAGGFHDKMSQPLKERFDAMFSLNRVSW